MKLYIFLFFTQVISIEQTKSYLKPLFGSIDVLLMEKRDAQIHGLMFVFGWVLTQRNCKDG